MFIHFQAISELETAMTWQDLALRELWKSEASGRQREADENLRRIQETRDLIAQEAAARLQARRPRVPPVFGCFFICFHVFSLMFTHFSPVLHMFFMVFSIFLTVLVQASELSSAGLRSLEQRFALEVQSSEEKRETAALAMAAQEKAIEQLEAQVAQLPALLEGLAAGKVAQEAEARAAGLCELEERLSRGQEVLGKALEQQLLEAQAVQAKALAEMRKELVEQQQKQMEQLLEWLGA